MGKTIQLNCPHCHSTEEQKSVPFEAGNVLQGGTYVGDTEPTGLTLLFRKHDVDNLHEFMRLTLTYRRYRECQKCQHRYATLEIAENDVDKIWDRFKELEKTITDTNLVLDVERRASHDQLQEMMVENTRVKRMLDQLKAAWGTFKHLLD